ncbi:MAG: TonB-dependent receptor [Clostridium sp.]|nr:TonB-dependent receptor [Prevotella sp.]MCM1429090.1 TonB-dependent receptor [Clostridium sp.]MCM1475380.1 TonB-dependent receptor [Muribaculaceae bacterium]
MKKYLLLILLSVVCLGAAAQTLKVSGTVSSAEDNEPLIGATVQVKENRSVGVATDIDGNYEITVAPGQTLIFSYVGYTPTEKKVTSSGKLDITLDSSAEMLQEVVAIGYGTVKKSDLTGSVSTVAADKLSRTPAASLSNALQGQAAGVTVNSLTGRPGASAEVRIRGVGTVNNASPIYVVDGVITDDISFLSPNDIEHTEILKDASATAIYGSRGANGVIIVTTRSGKLNKDARVNFDAYIGMQQRWKKLDVMNASQYADAIVAINGNPNSKKYYQENGFNEWLKVFNGVGASDFFPTVYNPDTNPTGFDYASQETDWQDEIFRNGLIQNYHLGIDGGGERFTYSASGSWFGQQGIIRGSDYSRFTARLNTTYQAFPWLKIGENISFTASKAQNAYESGDNSESAGASIISAAFAMAPWDPVRYPEGSVNRKGQDLSGGLAAGSNFKNVTNPFSMIEYSHPKVRNERWVGNVFLELTPIKYLTFRSSFNFDYRITTDKSFMDSYIVSAYDKRDDNFLSSSMARAYYYNVDNILTYARTIGKHDFSAMVGQTVEQYDYYSIGNSGSTILNPVENNWYLSQVTENFGRPSDSVSRNRRFSWLGRLNYNFDGRYMATVNFRADGSSRFPENSWGYFPSFALAWRLSREKFLSDFSNLNDLKLRFGWGKVGNDNIGNNAFILNMFNNGPTFVDYPFGVIPALQPGATVLTWINNGGHWENTEQWSLGVDFGFFNNRLTGSVDGFIRKTNDMLMSVNAPAHVGNRYPGTANVGRVRNQGIEISLEHRNTVNDWFHYSVGGNISFIGNKLTDLNGGSPIYTNYDQVQVVNQGFPLYYFWGYNYEGVYQTDAEVLEYLNGYTAADSPFAAGDAKYRDNNGDGVINGDDRVFLGSSIPKVNYGINLSAYLKDFDIQLFFQGAGGNKIYNQMRHRLESNGQSSILSPIMTDAWTVDNTDGSIPNPRNSVNYYTSDRFLEKGDYFRLKNLQIGYTLPQSILGKSGLKNCRFYVQISNLFTITKYKGFDPEVSGGVDYGNYPQCRTFLFGVNISY